MNIDKVIVYGSIVCVAILGSALLLDGEPLRELDWIKSAPIPEPRADYAAGVIDGKLVIAGGTYWEGTKGRWIKKYFSASTHAFDPVTQVWEKLPDLPTPLGFSASAVIENKLFVLGGYTGLEVNRKIYTLEKAHGQYAWRIFGEMPTDRLFAGAVSVGRSLYLLGGTTQFEPLDSKGTCCTSKTATKSFLMLDTAHTAKGWQQLAPYPGAIRWSFSIETDGESIWIFGGRFQAERNDPLTNFSEVLCYRIAEARWGILKPLPEVTRNAVSPSPVLVHGKMILISDSRRVWQLDLKTLKYSELSPLPEAAVVDKFVWLKDRIIGAGGESTVEGPRRRSEWTFVGRFISKHDAD